MHSTDTSGRFDQAVEPRKHLSRKQYLWFLKPVSVFEAIYVQPKIHIYIIDWTDTNKSELYQWKSWGQYSHELKTQLYNKKGTDIYTDRNFKLLYTARLLESEHSDSEPPSGECNCLTFMPLESVQGSMWAVTSFKMHASIFICKGSMK